MTTRREIRFLLNDKEVRLDNVGTSDTLLDFLLGAEALVRGAAAYIGMIGSKIKRASFKNWYHRDVGDQSIDALTCPIGATGSRDKRPAVIAAFVVAEVITALTSETTVKTPVTGAVFQ